MNVQETARNLVTIGEVEKGQGKVLRVSVGEFHGRVYVYCQLFEKVESGEGPGQAMHGGLTFRPDTVLELLPLLEGAVAAATVRGGR